MRILAIGAHPDDVEFGCGGLMIKEIQKGNEVKYLICSLGEAGSNGKPVQRKQEALTAAKLIGAAVEFANFGGDGKIVNSPKNAITIAAVIRQFKPHLVLAPSLTGNQHPDHLAIAQITRAACRLARYGGLKELKKTPAHRINALYYYPSSAEWDKRPDLIVDVSDVYEKWLAAMACHKSQMKTKSYLHLVSAKAAYIGSTIGVKYAIGLWVNDPIRISGLSDLKLSSRNY